MGQDEPRSSKAWWLVVCCQIALAGCAASAWGQGAASRFPIGNAAVIAAMQQRQVPVSGLQVRIAAPITASVAHPELEIRSLTMGDKHTAQLLVSCRNSAECLPFYVSAAWPDEEDAAGLHMSLERAAKSLHDLKDRLPDADGNSFRAGSQATLLLDGERVHVMLRVVCLQSGEPGERVRVTTPDRRQEYVADVIAPGVLKGTF